MIEQIFDPSVEIIRDIFRPIVGRPCWGSKCITGSIISLEFGVVARPPRPSPYDLRRSLENPSANLPIKVLPAGGEWNFSLIDANWTIRVEDAVINSLCSTHAQMNAVIAILNGQILKSVDWLNNRYLLLTFYEGAKIHAEIDPEYDVKSTAWWLLQTDGIESSFDGTGKLTLLR